MLVLSRKKNETIVCGEGENQIVITILEIRGDKVRISFSASKDIIIHRKEVYDAIKREGLRESATIKQLS